MRVFLIFLLGALAFEAPLNLALAKGDVRRGEMAFAKCEICHQVGPGAQNLVGPELNGIVGRNAASVGDFVYSPGLKKLGEEGFIWTEEALDAWIANPKAMLPDSPMALAFQPISSAEERSDIIAYLKTFSVAQ